MRLGNKKYLKGIGTHAPSEIVYALEGNYVRFQAVVGPPEQNGTVVFRVFGDDKLLFDSGVLRGRHSAAVDVPSKACGGCDSWSPTPATATSPTRANWAAARLKKKEPLP